MKQSFLSANNFYNSSEMCHERQMLLYILGMGYAKKPFSLIFLLLCQIYYYTNILLYFKFTEPIPFAESQKYLRN